MPQASVPHRVPARNRGSTRFPARARGRGGGGGRQRGLCSRSLSAVAAARGPRPPCRPSLRPARQRSPQLGKETWARVPAGGGVLNRAPGGGGPRAPLGRDRDPFPPLLPALRLPAAGGLGATQPGLQPPPLARRSVPAGSACQRAHSRSPGPTRALRRQPGTQRRAHAPPRVPHTPAPAPRRVPRRATLAAAPPTFPDSGDAGSVPRVALAGGSGPEQQQQQRRGPSQRAGDAGAPGGESGRRRCHPPNRATEAAAEPAPEGGVKAWPHPAPPLPASGLL